MTVESEIGVRRAKIVEARAEQRALELEKDDAIALEYRLLNQLDVCHRIQGRCDTAIEARRQAISMLQDEITTLLPTQREP